jgi:hypothetical protein
MQNYCANHFKRNFIRKSVGTLIWQEEYQEQGSAADKDQEADASAKY